MIANGGYSATYVTQSKITLDFFMCKLVRSVNNLNKEDIYLGPDRGGKVNPTCWRTALRQGNVLPEIQRYSRYYMKTGCKISGQRFVLFQRINVW